MPQGLQKRQDGTFVRIMDCGYCDRYELQLDPQTPDQEIVRKLNKKGLDVGTKEDEISEVRKKDLGRLSSKQQ